MQSNRLQIGTSALSSVIFHLMAIAASAAPCSPQGSVLSWGHWVRHPGGIPGNFVAEIHFGGSHRGDECGLMFDPITGEAQACDCGVDYLNCVGGSYAHLRLNHKPLLDAGCPTIILGQTVTIITDDIEAFYDHEYTGYTKISPHDLSQNCHGFAFKVSGAGGGWIHDSGIYGLEGMIASPWCWENQGADLSQNPLVAHSAASGHSVKILVDPCPEPETTEYRIVFSLEKHRDSGLYQKLGTCQQPVGLKTTFNGQPLPGGFEFFTKEY
jgi:hypothetical protein